MQGMTLVCACMIGTVRVSALPNIAMPPTGWQGWQGLANRRRMPESVDPNIDPTVATPGESCQSCVRGVDVDGCDGGGCTSGLSVKSCMNAGITDCCDYEASLASIIGEPTDGFKEGNSCACTKCVCKGNTQEDCEAFGLDCSCFDDDQIAAEKSGDGCCQIAEDAAMGENCGDMEWDNTDECVICVTNFGCTDATANAAFCADIVKDGGDGTLAAGCPSTCTHCEGGCIAYSAGADGIYDAGDEDDMCMNSCDDCKQQATISGFSCLDCSGALALDFGG
jgi:hypothetical protein